MRIGSLRRKYLLFLVVCIGVITGAFALVRVPTPAAVKAAYKPSDVWIVDRNGIPLEALRVNSKRRSLEWVRAAEISPAFHELLISTEDKRFETHWGFDPIAAIHAAWARITNGSARGASTITMQLVGLLNEKGLGSARRTPIEKFFQIAAAIKIEFVWSKNSILEAYVNLLPFRGELVGLRAASIGLFKKPPLGLERDEAALLVALIRAPNADPNLVAKRACTLLHRTDPAPDCRGVYHLTEAKLLRPYQLTRTRDVVPVLSERFTDPGSRGASLIRTSLDASLQRLTVATLRDQLQNLKHLNVHDGAVLILETKTGRVAAYAANAGSGAASASQTDGIQMRRQAGSTLKPFIYATAFDWNLLTPTSLLDDSPADFPIAFGKIYHPQNYDHQFRGLVGVADALASSLNVPAVRALQLIGERPVLDSLKRLGFEKLEDEGFYGPSLALGTLDVSLWELTQGYRQLAIDPSPFREPTRKAIFNILASAEHRRFTFGLESQLSLPFPAAVKTGTSKDMRDNWCIGWTEAYTIGVWVGNFNGEPMWNVSGQTGAAPIWRSLMLALNPPTPNQTDAVYREPDQPLTKRSLSGIRYPPADTLIGYDPDIPKAVQTLPIEIDNPQTGHLIYINKKLLGPARETSLWPIQRGKFLVELRDRDGMALDSKRFEVR